MKLKGLLRGRAAPRRAGRSGIPSPPSSPRFGLQLLFHSFSFLFFDIIFLSLFLRSRHLLLSETMTGGPEAFI